MNVGALPVMCFVLIDQLHALWIHNEALLLNKTQGITWSVL